MGIAPGTYYINAVGSSVSLIMDGTQASSDFLIEGVISSDKFCSTECLRCPGNSNNIPSLGVNQCSVLTLGSLTDNDLSIISFV